MRRRLGIGVLAIGVLAWTGCARRETPGAADATEMRAEGTPAGGLKTWLSDITSGMPTNGAAMETDWEALQERLLDLYVGRYEYVEAYWGPNGRLQGEGGEAVGQSVLDLQTAFHDLLQRFMAVPLDTTAVLAAAAKVRQKSAAVWSAAEVSGLPLTPPADSMPAGR